MKIKELFEVIDTSVSFPDISIIDDTDSRSVKTFKYPQNGINYVDEMLNQFGDRIVISNGVTFGIDDYGIEYIIVEVK